MKLSHLKRVGIFPLEHAQTVTTCGGARNSCSNHFDVFGLRVTTSSSECVDAVNAYYEAVLGHKPFTAWAVVDTAVQCDPRSPLPRVLAADCAFCCGNASRAKALLEELAHDAASAEVAAWEWREQKYVEAWTRWVVAGDPSGCYAALLEAVDRNPSDLFAVKRGQMIGLILGDGAKIFEIVQRASVAAPTSPPPKFLYGMWSFGFVEVDRFEEAEAKALEGLALEGVLGIDAWLDPGLARALYFQGEERLDDAIEFLESRRSMWSATELHPFLYTHNWWHLALFYCEQRNFGEAVRIFDQRLWADEDAAMRTDPAVQLNALGLLWRLETRGEAALARPRCLKVLQACKGVTLPSSADGVVGSMQHCDLLLDVFLVRGLCYGVASAAHDLDFFLASVESHADDLARGAGGAGGRAEAYKEIAAYIAELFREDRPEAGTPARHAVARKGLRGLKEKWPCLGGSSEQRGAILEAVEGPVVCGAPEVNYDTLFR